MQLEKYLLKFNSSKSGLSARQVALNQYRFGKNILTTKKRDGFFMILLHQLGSFFSVILLIAASILFVLGEFIDFYIILVVIILNALIESVQRYRSDSIFETLTKNLPIYTLVIRDGKRVKVESRDIVTGDVIVLSAGDKVPVDALVLYSQDFKVDEAILTGESRPVSKEETSGEYDVSSTIDNKHVVFSGSYVVTGEAHALVVLIGNETQMGLIASKINAIDSELPIHKNIKKLSFSIFVFVSILSIFVFIVGLVQMQSWTEIFKITVALFVSAIPESLPVMLTLVLAYGFKRMSDKNVLVRKMQSLDALGQINVLALDKTGTITHNQMKVEKIYTASGQELYVTGDGYEPEGKLIHEQKLVHMEDMVDVQKLIMTSALSANGAFSFNTDKQDWMLDIGDPTEVAMLVMGQKFGITKESFSDTYVFKKDIPFSNQKMYHEMIYLAGKKEVKFYTGAPEVILGMCDSVWSEGSVKKMGDKIFNKVSEKVKEYSSQGYRAIASCTQEGKKMIFTGIVAISDSVRSDIHESVGQVYQRGVEIIIITGDHKEIAYKVAKHIGLKCDESTILTGTDMQNLNDTQIQNIILHKNVFARVTPQQKLKILELLKKAGKVVAMTGDGVNDSLALVKSDIGIAMGKASSEAAKEASDIVLLDNKFGSIVYGIEEGKNIFSNIKKTIMFLLSTNFAEMFVVVFAITLALPLPLSAIAILWLNLVTDTFLVVGFAFERGSTEKRQAKNLLTAKEWGRILYLGLIMTFVALAVFMSMYHANLGYAQSLTLLVVIMMQWFNVLNIRAGNGESVFKYSFRHNKAFIIGWLISLSLTIFAYSSSFMRSILEIQPIGLIDWLYALLIASTILWFEELRKVSRKVKLFSGKKILDL